ncbi:ATP phosphoribosyltransferase [Paucilactobacillus suebicus]|uniref:ATP phosphoribosyltransferase n=1 Tax=Paucilactobacillus suebicus DSM 5007 = KCTC 3549 TaxID=1423807 RepID=A0A0R1W487_9LACO|nr:ATP phosphoribosyltransferase [Paucilactobacillus suebicus]KRM12354.1 ATP phosphoribosyltransferase [Paucilactobacillus suebicus DSM 5007 = KCTC 3549]
MTDRIKIALTKGRVEKQTLPLLEQAGFNMAPVRDNKRKLIFDLPDDPYTVILAKGPDVSTYLSQGAVDIGIVGSDILTEQQNQAYELLDLGIGKCQFVLASTKDFDPKASRRKVIGTKYPLITQRYFAEKGEDVEVVKIEGSVELAPLIGMADAIVDITETGTTLRENHLQIYDRLQEVSTRVVVNPMSLKQHRQEIFDFVDRLNEVIKKPQAN